MRHMMEKAAHPYVWKGSTCLHTDLTCLIFAENMRKGVHSIENCHVLPCHALWEGWGGGGVVNMKGNVAPRYAL